MPLYEKDEPFHDPLEALDRLLSHFGYRGVVIGGIAVGLLSQPRFTEDLIIMKAVAHRPKDLLDIQGIIQSNPGLDREHIRDWVTQFATLLEMPELWDDIESWL